jgi:hypothetical protein
LPAPMLAISRNIRSRPKPIRSQSHTRPLAPRASSRR